MRVMWVLELPRRAQRARCGLNVLFALLVLLTVMVLRIVGGSFGVWIVVGHRSFHAAESSYWLFPLTKYFWKQRDSESKIPAPTTSDPQSYTLFTSALLYPHSGSSDAPYRALTSDEQDWFDDMRRTALEFISRRPTARHFQYGWYRHRGLGTEFEFVFTDPADEEYLDSVRLYVPLKRPRLVQSFTVPHDELVHVVVFTSGDVTLLEAFVQDVCQFVLPDDSHIQLTFVSASKAVREVLERELAQFDELQWRVRIYAEGSPHRSLQVLGRPDPSFEEKAGDLLLLVDDGVLFKADFVTRCRTTAIRTQQVYFPVAFSLYDPELLYSTKGLPLPPLQEQLHHGSDFGAWNPNEFRAACLHRGDLTEVARALDGSLPSDAGSKHAPLLYLLHAEAEKHHHIIRSIRIEDPDLFVRHHGKRGYPPQPCPQQQREAGALRPQAGVGAAPTSSLPGDCTTNMTLCTTRLGSKLVLGLALLHLVYGTDVQQAWQTQPTITALMPLLVVVVCCCGPVAAFVLYANRKKTLAKT